MIRSQLEKVTLGDERDLLERRPAHAINLVH